MDLGFRGRACTLALLALAGLAQPAEASHFRYGTLSWASTGNPNDPAEVRFRLRASFRRTEFGNVNIGDAVQENVGPTVLFFGDGDSTIPLFFRVTAVSLTEDWFLGEAVDGPLATEFGIVHSYANAPAPPGPAGPFIAFLRGIGSPIPLPDTNPAACCRIADPANPQPGEENLANRAGLAYPLQTLVFPTSGNSSPVSTMVPIVVVPPSATATFTVPAVDPDGDAITWRLSTDEEAGGPMHPPGISIDPTTGVVTWNNLGLEQAPTFWTTQFVIEDHDTTGAVKTKTPVDFLLLIRPQVDNLPTCAISPGGPLSATVGNMLSFTVTGTDVDPNDMVTLNVGAIPSGATLTPALPVTGASPQSSVFAWTPAAADVGAHTVMFSATDTAGQQGLCQTTIEVIPDNPDAPTCAIDPPGPHTVQLGSSLSFTVTGTDPTAGDSVTLDVGSGGLPLGAAMTPALPFTGPTGVQSTFNWTPSAGDLGPHLITFTATDSTALQRTCQTTVQVVPANPNAPTCSIDPSQTVTVGTPVGFTVMGTDPDPNDVLNLALTSGALPSGATLTPTLPTTGASPLSSVFSWTPSLADAGVAHTFSFLVTDTAAQQADCQTTITVLGAVNNPPVCTIEFLSGTGGPGGGGDDDDNGDHDDEDDDGDNGHDNDGDDDKDRGGNGDSDREVRRNRNGQALSILADRESDHDGDDRDDDNGDSDDDDGDGGNGGGGGGVPAGRLVAFRVTGTDPDLGDVLTLTDIVPAGTTMTPPLPLVGGSPVISEGQWTPNLGQVGPQVFSFTVTDLAGAQGFCMATVEVVQRPPRCEIVFPDGGGDGDDKDNDDDKENDKDDDKDRDKDKDNDGDRDKDRDGDRDARRVRAHRDGGNGENDNGNGDGDNGDEGGRSVRPGTRVTFRVRATDPDVGDIITLVSGPLPSGASMDPALPLTGSSPLVSRFLWTPTQTQLGTHVITFTVTDLAGEQGMCRARIKVTKRGRGCPNGDDDKDNDDKDKDGDRDDDESQGDDRRAGTEDASRATNGVSHRDRDGGNGDNGDGDNGDGDNGDGEGCKPDDDGHDGGDKDDDKDRDKDRDHDRDKDQDQGDGDRDSANH